MKIAYPAAKPWMITTHASQLEPAHQERTSPALFWNCRIIAKGCLFAASLVGSRIGRNKI